MLESNSAVIELKLNVYSHVHLSTVLRNASVLLEEKHLQTAIGRHSCSTPRTCHSVLVVQRPPANESPFLIRSHWLETYIHLSSIGVIHRLVGTLRSVYILENTSCSEHLD